MITKRDYLQAITDLKLAMTQLEPDGLNCAVCGDTGHQAMECHFNPLVVQEQVLDFQHTWRCYHCSELFTEHKLAGDHFGQRLGVKTRPICCTSEPSGE